MKLVTKIAIAANVAVIASMSYLYYDLKSTEASKEAEVISVMLEVERQLAEAKELNCLATNIYHEARNDGLTGQRAVAWATMNRVESEDYPDSICGVVYQAEMNENGIPKKNRCSFSWFCDGKSDVIDDQAAWNVAENIAEEVMNAYGNETDPTNGSVMYHAHYVTPYWASSYEKQVRIDSHIFYN
jgi:spore germination cell wall hydrolase CwlJ-like protein